MNTINFTNFTVSLAWLCGLLVSCHSTDYISQESLPTGMSIIISNEEYTEEKFGDIKRKKDSIDEQYGRMNPEVISTTLNGYFRVTEIRKELGVLVLFLENISDTFDPLSSCKQVLSLSDKPYYKGETLTVGKVYHFELSPLNFVNTAPPLGLSMGIDCTEKVLLENRWLVIRHYCGENIYSSGNLNGDKYTRNPRKKSKTEQ